MRNGVRRLHCAALVCVLTAQLLCAGAFAEGETIYLDDAKDLIAFAAACSYDAWSEGKHVVLRQDISLGGVAFDPIPGFGGDFDGGGHTISGLNVSGSDAPAGLFGTIAVSGTVHDLTVVGSVAPSGSGEGVGGIAGVNRGRVENCSFTGTVRGERAVGGIAGVNEAAGTLLRCESGGGVFGGGMTGGVAGENHGVLSGCVNRAFVNTAASDPGLNLDALELNPVSGLNGLLNPGAVNITVDSGGIAGFSDGELLGCVNRGSVGYQHVGYNVGGIAGRSSGHIASCVNYGSVDGRREVGGVAGMAEPFVRLELRSSSLAALRQELDALSQSVDRAISDAQGGSETVSARLTQLNRSVDQVADDARGLTEQLEDAYDTAASELSRGGEILSASVDRLDSVTKELLSASDRLSAALDALRGASDTVGGDAAVALREAETELDTASDTLRQSVSEAERGAAGLRGAIRQVPPDVEAASAGVEDIRSAYAGLGTSAEALRRGVGKLEEATASAGEASEELGDSMEALRDASTQLSGALRDMDSLLGYLEAQEKLSFSRPPEAGAASDALYGSVRGVSGQLALLNRDVSASSDTLLEDLRQINLRFTALMDTLLGLAEEEGNASVRSAVEDTSDEDIDAVFSGKLLLCENEGTVSGDIDVGGIAGATAVYNELDPERDADTVSSLLRSRYELKCVLQNCVNRGRVSGKRNNVGAVCGGMTLGVLSGCEGYGFAESESGECVGGIAGFADGTVRDCWAKCSLAGERYVGGIVGGGSAERSGLRVLRCRALPEITRCGQYGGAILGAAAGTAEGNLFVSDSLSGIDRLSIRAQAEPVGYGQLLEEDGVPGAFREFTLTFSANGETVAERRFSYGESLDASVFPAIPEVAGQYGHWDRVSLNNLRFDTTVNAVYAPRLSAIGSRAERSAARCVFLAEGSFDGEAVLSADPAVYAFNAGQEDAWRVLRSYRREILEQWELSIPEDGAAVHQLRYLPPEGAPDRLEIYALTDGVWTRLETGNAGSCLTFPLAGNEAGLTVLAVATPWWVWTLFAVFLLGAAALLTELLLRRKPKQAPETEEERAKLARRMKNRRRLRVCLIAAVLVFGIAVAAAVRLAPKVSEGLGVYHMLRSYAERTGLDMQISLQARLGESDYAADVQLCHENCGEQRVSRMEWKGIPVYFCDGAMLLEDGSAWQADGVVADYSALLAHAASLYHAMDVTLTAENNVKSYHAVARGEEAERVLTILLPGAEEYLPETEAVSADLTVTDGEMTSLLLQWNGADDSVSAKLTILGESEHTIPQAVRSTIASGGCSGAPALEQPRRSVLPAWLEAAFADPMTVQLRREADCGPVLVDEDMTWQRGRSGETELCCLSRRGSALYYTADAACTGTGVPVERTGAAGTDTAELLRLAFETLLLGGGEGVQSGDEYHCTAALDEERMARFSALIAPETETLAFSREEGTLELVLRDGMAASLRIRIGGSVSVSREELPAELSLTMQFDRSAAFRTPSAAVRSALGLR